MNDEIILNNGQKIAGEAFFNFLLSKEKQMGISGPGGVGKTFLMGHMIDEIIPQYYNMCKMMNIEPQFNEVVMTATTNKAAEVLSRATKRPTETIYSFLNLKVVDDYSTGKSNITKTSLWKVHENKVIFIDESSYVPTDLYNYIQEGTLNCKIVYVGDHCQLAPVTEPISPVFKNNIPHYELLEPMRNANQPALLDVCAQLRETVETGVFKPIKVVPGVIDHVNDSELEKLLEEHFMKPATQDKILAYTNDRVISYNDHIRDMRNFPDQYVLGEILVNNNAVRLKGSMLSVEAEVTITALKTDKETISLPDDVSFDIHKATLETADGSIYTDVPLPADRFHFRNMISYFQKKKSWKPFFDLKNNYPDLRQRDASTIYKAQGSTHNTVFLDLTDLSKCRNPSQTARQLYVTFTRPRNRVIMYGELAERFGGVIH